MESVSHSRPRALVALLSAFLLVSPAFAQGSPAAPSAPAAAPNATTRVGADVFQKLRPTAFRIEQRAANATTSPDGIGTGFFISKDGLALTAYHVVFGAKDLSARLVGSDKRVPLEVIGFDDYNDIALLRVKVTDDVPFLPLAQTSPKIGDAALAIGNGGGAFLKDKYGTFERLDVASDRADFPSGTLELNAQLIPGDSGGPIINAKGEAVGVVSYIQVGGSSTGGSNLRIKSYAIPVTQSSKLVADLRGGVKRDAPVLGVSRGGQIGNVAGALDDADELFPSVGLGSKLGVTFSGVQDGSPAAKAGLKPLVLVDQGNQQQNRFPQFSGDVIVAIDGKAVRAWNDLVSQIRGKKIGDAIKLTVARGGQTVEVNVTLAARAEIYGSR